MQKLTCDNCGTTMDFTEDPDSEPVTANVCEDMDDLLQMIEAALEGKDEPKLLVEGMWRCNECGDMVPGFWEKEPNA